MENTESKSFDEFIVFLGGIVKISQYSQFTLPFTGNLLELYTNQVVETNSYSRTISNIGWMILEEFSFYYLLLNPSRPERLFASEIVFSLQYRLSNLLLHLDIFCHSSSELISSCMPLQLPSWDSRCSDCPSLA